MSISPTSGHVHFKYLIMEGLVGSLHCNIIYPLEVNNIAWRPLEVVRQPISHESFHHWLVLAFTGNSWSIISVLSNDDRYTLPWLPSLYVGTVLGRAGLSSIVHLHSNMDSWALI